MTLLLRNDEVLELMDLPKAMEVIRETANAQAKDAVDAKAPMMLPMADSALRVVLGAVGEPRRAGARVNPAGRGNAKTVPAIATVYDEPTGELLAVMSYPFGTLRISATMALATQLLAPADADTIGVIGSGHNLRAVLAAVARQRPVSEIRVFSRNAARRSAFAEDVSAQLGISVRAVGSAAVAVGNAPVVLVGTSSLEPVLHADLMKERGSLLLSYGHPNEIDPSVHSASDKIVVGSKTHERGWVDPWLPDDRGHPLLSLTETGDLRWESVAELGDLTSGKVPGRTSQDERIVFKDSEGGFWDIALASAIYDSARMRGLGTDFTFA
ncbi:hypothetical protein [Streptomyces albipurpureus]|uniref:Ornithine cyclodeaminase n=1 Tax=Streptomyces albipurpureus TaxID=2897419 RepID=A0ABT0UUR7_9ACTN|nr:hypothetical protein [Streptomyces sp. CWNU-1]MCM2391865.1 hypothetical protein [Streptomyces sp. CWNU-1]